MRVASASILAFALFAGCLSTESGTTSTTTLPAGSEGGFCNYMTGIECGGDLMCRPNGDTDGGGVCVSADETGCRVPADCEGRPHIMCAGAWMCAGGRCSWDCDILSENPVVVVE